MINEEMQAAMNLNEKRIMRQYKKLEAEMEFLKKMIEKKDWRGYGESVTDGHFTKEVAAFTALVGKQQVYAEIASMEE